VGELLTSFVAALPSGKETPNLNWRLVCPRAGLDVPVKKNVFLSAGNNNRIPRRPARRLDNFCCSLSITNWWVALKLAAFSTSLCLLLCDAQRGGIWGQICGYSKVSIVIATSTDWTYILRSDWM
jgi:hypothetical protein